MIETANPSKEPSVQQGENRLSKKTVEVLGLIARGLSYDQIVKAGHAITYPDIFEAAKETLSVYRSSVKYYERIEKVKRKHPKAYQRWSTKEERKLTDLVAERKCVEEIAAELGRQPSAIQARLEKLGLVESRW